MKDKNELPKVKRTAAKNVELSYVLHSAVGRADVKEYDVEVVASDEALAADIEREFTEAGAERLRVSYLDSEGELVRLKGEPSLEETPSTEQATSVEQAPVTEPQAPAEEGPQETEEASSPQTEAEPREEKVVKKQDFARFKKRVRTRVALVALLFGLCVGLAAAGVSMVVLKTLAMRIEENPLLLLAIGGGAALVAFLVFWLIARHGDKRLAVKLDKVYGLGESVQTMVQYKNATSGIAELQREATDEKLSRVKRKKATLWHKLALALLPVFALATVATGLAAPQKVIAKPKPWEDQTHVLRESQINELKKVIENVETDKELLSLQPLPDARASTSLTAQYLESLNTLLKTLEGELTNQQFVDAVTNAMQSVMSATAEKTSYREIAKRLKAQEKVAFLGEALVNGAKAYDTVETVTYSFVRAQAGETLSEAVKAALTAGTKTITVAVDECDWTNYNAVVLGYKDGLEDAIAEMEISEEDELFKAVSALSLALNTLGNVDENFGLGLPQLREYLASNAVGPFDKDGSAVLYQQSYYSLMKDYVCDSLHEIFEVEIPPEKDEDGSTENGGNSDDDPENPDDHEHNKFPNWPSGDLVVDINGEKVHYGEILDEGNYAKILSLLDNKDLPKEIREYIIKYLDAIKSTDDGNK